MLKTLVFQSHFPVPPSGWLRQCLDSVQHWARANHYEYCLLGDELFQFVPAELRQKFARQPVILTDLGRAQWAQHFLGQGYDDVLWLDSDFLIFRPDAFYLPRDNTNDLGYALGREVWVQRQSGGALKAYKKVHNAALYFQQNNAFVDFYITHASRLLAALNGHVPPQFIGPKLLTALHNILSCPVMEYAGVFSPLVIEDIVGGERKALELMLAKSSCPPSGANLCSSMVATGRLSDEAMQLAVERLLSGGSGFGL